MVRKRMQLQLSCIVLGIWLSSGESFSAMKCRSCPNLPVIGRSIVHTLSMRSSRDDGGYTYSSSRSRSALHTQFEDKNDMSVGSEQVSSVRSVNQLFSRCTWISWWVQLVLSVISSVILVFANTVRQAGMKQSLWASGFSFSVIGVMICLLNSFWTWNTARLSRRITARKIPESSIFPTMRRYCQISVVIALIGMFITIISAEMIVGNLVSKTLLSSQVVGVVPVLSANGVAQNTLQALDIFLVQANTNALVAHFSPLVCYLFLQTQIPRQIRETTTLPITVPIPATEKNE